MINIFLCDDTPLQLRHVHEFIENYMQNQPACIFDYSSPKGLLSGLDNHSANITILDIDLGKGKASGIDLAKTIKIGRAHV